MARLTDLPNELIIKIFRDHSREKTSTGKVRYLREFWYLPYLDELFLPLCLEENFRLHCQKRTSADNIPCSYEEKLDVFKVQEASYVNGKFSDSI